MTMQFSSRQVFAMSPSLVTTTAIIVATIVFLSIFAYIAITTKQSAFADGLTQEQLSASLGNRKADLLIKMNPPVVTTETLSQGQKPTVEFRLFDSNTNQSFSHVTYYIILEKDGKRLLSDMFHDHNGDLKIQVNPINTTTGNAAATTNTSGGKPDPLLDILTASETNPIIASGPIFVKGGLYHFIVRIETIDSDYTLLPNNQEPVYDSWLSIGNTENRQISIDGKQIPIKIISYYDKLSNFGFDNKNMQIKFDMPFNWNVSRINNTSIFVHEELYVPKPNAFTGNGSYIGKVNDVDISKNVMLDNTNPKKDIIHVMIPKNNLIQLADQVNKNGQASTGLMKFTLQPGRVGEAATMSSASMGGMPMSTLSGK
jgi:hypothetical protein